MVIVMDQTLRDEIAAACREHDLLLARDQGPSVQRDTRDASLVFKERENALAPVAAPSIEVGDDNAKNAEGWDQWLKAHLAIAKAEWFDEFARGMGEGLSEYTHEKLMPHVRAIAELRGELAECKGLLTSALSAFDAVRATTEALQQEKCERAIRDDTIRERSARIADLQRENAASHAELARKQRDQELAARDQRLELVETRLRMLCQFLSVGGYDLPRGM
jgi:hypothetical protein